jgi:hypothetical protein
MEEFNIKLIFLEEMFLSSSSSAALVDGGLDVTAGWEKVG